jgi:hypothetical protein
MPTQVTKCHLAVKTGGMVGSRTDIEQYSPIGHQ